MSHTIENKARLLSRVRRIKGQLEAVERALEAETPCIEILRQIASIRGAAGSLSLEVIEGHVRKHVMDVSDPEERKHGGEEVIEVIKTYLK
ncbi:MAG: metal/formaldehyde-sensitive transcriptional repressor [Zymomonas mobilis]|uniref:DNA-binding FrmR family transcriptional regulator n=1 Tax=Zymomonas mobilis TaxID=542 RepID=A0A542W243_ZYMMB|nr:metal/formaldehyde-sensitive transcriptional repressor [Zymomonas mobilis]TQL17652.1 DNA-binding FrmR family transcriptional regulator [Zymomonas mobilis]